jgi:hypothetical protein
MLLSFCMDIYLGGVLKIYMLLAMRKPWNFCIIIGAIMYCEQ